MLSACAQEHQSPSVEFQGTPSPIYRNSKEIPEEFYWTVGAKEQARGFYSSQGSLVSPSQFLMKGKGYLKLRPQNQDGYGTHDLVRLVQWAAEAVAAIYPQGEPLRVGSASRRQGGRFPPHSSHQNGLDVDLGYYLLSGRQKSLGVLSLNTYSFGESMVKTNNVVSKNLDLERTWVFFKLVVSSTRVSRIFVSPTIRKAFFRYSKQDLFTSLEEKEEVLRRLRPEPGHNTHFHLRLDCPPRSPSCVDEQAP